MALPVALATLAHAQTAPLPAAPNPFVEEQRQQERERALRRQQERTVDTRLQTDVRPEDRRLPKDEAPCFRIDRIVLAGERAEDFQWALAAAGEGGDDPRGRCLGPEGIDIVMARLQRAVVVRGYVTTRVLAAPQQLDQGTLALTLIPGRIAAIRFAEGSEARTSLAAAIPARPGDLVDLRDIEQGLENLKRAPTAEADIQIEPSTAADARPGDSDLVVKYAQRFPLRTTLSLDDSGTRATGKRQAGATVAWDDPLGLGDLFYVSLNHDAFNHRGQGTSGQTVHYSVPWGYWLASATASQGKYHQTVQGADQAYVYAGESANAELKLARLVYRDQHRKTTLALRGFRRSAHNFVEDVEMPVQRRATAGWELGLAHREFIGAANLSQCMALTNSANLSLTNLMTAYAYADSAEKKALVSDLLGRQLEDMTKLYNVLATQQEAAGLRDLIGAAITGSLQAAGVVGMSIAGKKSGEYRPSGLPEAILAPGSTILIGGVKVVDQRSGIVYQGTVDIQPTLKRINDGGAPISRNDGSIFQNRPVAGVQLLPPRPLGHYTEYVVPTPGVSGPGPQRVVIGRDGEIYYTPDHYQTFIPVKK